MDWWMVGHPGGQSWPEAGTEPQSELFQASFATPWPQRYIFYVSRADFLQYINTILFLTGHYINPKKKNWCNQIRNRCLIDCFSNCRKMAVRRWLVCQGIDLQDQGRSSLWFAVSWIWLWWQSICKIAFRRTLFLGYLKKQQLKGPWTIT